MGWKELDDREIKSHLKYTKDWDQAKRFVKTKKQLLDLMFASCVVFWFSKKLKKKKWHPATVEILIEGYANNEFYKKAIIEGIEGFIPKPFTYENVVMLLVRVLEDQER